MNKLEMVKVLKDPEQIELFENPNYSRIIYIMRKGELTVKEIHRLFNENYEDKKTLTSIYRYMEKLLEHGLVFVSREELKRGHLIEKYYSRTAMIFLFENEKIDVKVISAMSELLQNIYTIDEARKEELKKFFQEINREMAQFGVQFYEKYGEKVFQLEKEYGFEATKIAAKRFMEILYYRENPEFLEKVFEILEG
jgi:Fe2+ or Zn2+ uptake regulation protein